MNRTLKYSLIGVGTLFLLGVAALIALPFFLQAEKYKPVIEDLVLEKTGYPLSLGGEVNLSLFPWVGVSFDDLTIGNPEGFSSAEFIKIKRFKTGLKLLPLLGGDIEVSTFTVEGPEILLERSETGRWSWQGFTEQEKMNTSSHKGPATTSSPDQQVVTKEFPIKSITVGDFSITDGRVIIDDKKEKLKRQISDFNFRLSDISLDKPMGLRANWQLDNKPFSIEGSVGPVGKNPGADPLLFTLSLEALELLKTTIEGRLEKATTEPAYDLKVHVSPFNPQEVAQALGQELPVQTKDNNGLQELSLQLSAKGTANSLESSNAVITLDDSQINIDLKAENFHQPSLAVNLKVDQINLDRYLPPENNTKNEKQVTGSGQGEPSPAASEDSGPMKTQEAHKKKATDYTALRKIVLKLTAELKNIGIRGGKIDSLTVAADGSDGVFTLRSSEIKLYDGIIATNGQMSFTGDAPKIDLHSTVSGVQAGPLLHDFAQKDVLEGKTNADVQLAFAGSQSEDIKKSLNGKGNLTFNDGAIIGIDLAQLARQIKSGFSLENQGEKPKTDFAELFIPFTLTNGIFNTAATTLKSPFIRVTANGDADMVQERINMQVKPKVVSSIKGQGDVEDRSGVAIPVLVTGSFQQPKFSLDLEEAIKNEIPDSQEIQKIIETGEVPEDTQKSIDKGKKLLQGLFGK